MQRQLSMWHGPTNKITHVQSPSINLRLNLQLVDGYTSIPVRLFKVGVDFGKVILALTIMYIHVLTRNWSFQELKLKDEECEKLLKVRDQMGEELEDLTASLFEVRW